MTVRKSFLVILRIIFIVSTFIFMSDAFYLWDGYSFRMHFIDFLPDLSLTFLLWTFLALIFAIVVWITLYVVLKISHPFIKSIQFEHVMMWFIIFISLLVVQGYLFHFFLGLGFHKLTGLTLWTKGIIVGLLVTVLVWIGRKFFMKIPDKINTSITPLVWFFAFLLIIAVPLSFYKQSPAESNETIDNRAQFHTLNEEGNRPNIILVVMDALSAKDMSLYKYGVPTTPFISKWAKDAIVFKNVYSTTNWTSPAVMSIMTGQRPWTHRTWYEPSFVPKDINYKNNMPDILRDHGYETNCFVQNEYAHPYTLGIDKAFQRKDNSSTFNKSSEFWFFKLQSKLKNRPVASKWLFQHNFIAEKILQYAPDEHITLTPSEEIYNHFLLDMSKTNARNNQRIPFFAWLHTFPPHDPYLPPLPYLGVFGDAEKFNTQNKQLNSGIIYSEYNTQKQADVDILRKRYDEYILYSDKQFELFISHLQKSVEMSNTIIILTADHGESFSHGYQAHDGPHLYEDLVRVPLIIKMPGVVKGKVIETPVEITDIAPTILEFVGIPIPSWMEGRSMVPLINGNNDSRPVFSMQLIRNSYIGNNPITKGTFSVRDGNYKLIYYLDDKKTLLFNILSDPDETRNIISDETATAQRLLKLIEENLAKANKMIMQRTEKN